MRGGLQELRDVSPEYNFYYANRVGILHTTVFYVSILMCKNKKVQTFFNVQLKTAAADTFLISAVVIKS